MPLTESPADWENYEGVLISFSDVTIGSGGQYGQYALDGFDGIKLDDELFDYNVSKATLSNHSLVWYISLMVSLPFFLVMKMT